MPGTAPPLAKACLAEMALEGIVGPIPVEGTLTAADRPEIWDKTQCSAAVRARQSRERSLTISGPVSKLEQAHKLAMEAMEKKQAGA